MLDKSPERRPPLVEVRHVFAELVASGVVPIEPGSGTTFRSELARSRKDLESRTPRSNPKQVGAATGEHTPMHAPGEPSSAVVTALRARPPSDAPTHVEFQPGPGTMTPSTAAQTAVRPAAKSRRKLLIAVVVLALLVPTLAITIALVSDNSEAPAVRDAAVGKVSPLADASTLVDVPVIDAPAQREVTIRVNVTNARIEID